MTLSQSLLPEFDQEMASTRKTLERVPEAKFSWKPQSRKVWQHDLARRPLGQHCRLGSRDHQKRFVRHVTRGQTVRSTARAQVQQSGNCWKDSDKNVAEARAALAAASDADLLKRPGRFSTTERLCSLCRASLV